MCPRYEKPTTLVTNLVFYTILFLESMNDENFKKYREFTILMSRPEFRMIPKNIQNMAISHCEKHFHKYGYD